MRALYSLLSRLRLLYALVQGMVVLLHAGWAALAPMQLVTLGCVLCIALRVLAPAPSARRGLTVLADHLLSRVSAASVGTLQVAGIVGFCASCVELVLWVR